MFELILFFIFLSVAIVILGSAYAFLKRGVTGLRVFLKSSLAQFGFWDADDPEYFIEMWVKKQEEDK